MSILRPAALCVVSAVAIGTSAEHPRGVHTMADIESIRSKVIKGQEPWLAAYKDLIARADKSLARTPQPVADFNVPGYYGSNQEQHVKMKTFLSEETGAAYVCALAYRLAVKSDTTKRLSYGKKAAEILNKWASVNKKVSGADGNLVMSYNGNKMAVAGDLIHSSPVWDTADRTAFAAWVKNVLLKSADEIDTRTNNWGDWGTLGVIVSCCFLDDDARLTALVKPVRDRVLTHIKTDGHLPAETARGGNGMWYTYFALAPLTESCLILEKTTKADFFSTKQESGLRIKKALDHFLPYCKNPKSWPYATVTNLPDANSPQGWPGNMYEAMGDIYSNQEYTNYAALGRPHFRNSTGLAWVVPTLFRGTYAGTVTSNKHSYRPQQKSMLAVPAYRIDPCSPDLTVNKRTFQLNGSCVPTKRK